MAKLPEPPHDCPTEEPFVAEPCAEGVVELKDALVSPKPEPPKFGKKRLDRTLTLNEGMTFGEDLCALCFPCPDPATIDGPSAMIFAVMMDNLMCCFPYELEPNNCKGTFARSVKKGDIFYNGHPAVTGAQSKILKNCADYAATFPEMAPQLGAMTNLYGANSMPYIDWDCMNMRGLEKMLQMYAHIRDTWLAVALEAGVSTTGTPFEERFPDGGAPEARQPFTGPVAPVGGAGATAKATLKTSDAPE